MSEIWSLTTLCRCCHTDGQFKSLSLVYSGLKGAEIYEVMLRETLGVALYIPPFEASYTICDECIKQLKAASEFKAKVLQCDEKFKVYCTNEQFLTGHDTVKVEVEEEEDNHSYHDDFDNDELPPIEEDVKKEFNIEVDIKNLVQKDEEIKSEEKPPTPPKTKVAKKRILKKEPSEKTPTPPKTKDVKKRILKKGPSGKALGKTVSVKKTVTFKKEKEPAKKRPATEEINTVQKKIKSKEEKDVSVPKRKTKVMPEIINYIKKETENGIEYYCKFCENPTIYKNRKSIYEHIRKLHQKQILQCHLCKKLSTTKKGLKTHHLVYHTPNIHKPELVKCDLCPRIFKTEQLYKEHRLYKHTDWKYTCDYCKKDFVCRSTLLKHMNWHLGKNKRHLCDVCGWGFNDVTNLRKHVESVHKKLRPYQCNLCDKGFTAKKHLKEHLKKHSETVMRGNEESGVEPVFECDICQKPYQTQRYRDLHRLTHDGIYKCRNCKQEFDTKEARAKHVFDEHQRASRELRLACNFCPKVFKDKYNLNKHEETIHRGIYKFFCDVCQRKFPQRSSLERHKFRIHAQNKPTEFTNCEVCKKKVKNIEQHMLSHNARIYACDLCDKAYPANNNLTRHIEAVHNGRCFVCEVCNKKYIQRAKLVTHRKKKHGLETPLPVYCETIVKSDEWMTD